jgi:hypothetical protein
MCGRLLVRLATFAGIALAGAASCTGEADKQVLPPEVLAMDDTIAPAFDDGDEQIFQVSKDVRLPMRAPHDGERPEGDVAPYPRSPFNRASDTRITVRFTLSNLQDQRRTVTVLIDPWNEFVRYVPGVVQEDEETIPNFSGIERQFILEPFQRLEGIVTPDDMVELAVDLATAMAVDSRPPPAESQFAGGALFNRAFNVQNRSSEPDPVLAPYMPAAVSGGVVAGITGFDVGLRTTEPSRVAIELVIDVEDVNGERVIKEGEDEDRIGRPDRDLSPPAPAAP